MSDNLSTYEFLLNLPGLKVDAVELESKSLHVHCRMSPKPCQCPSCGNQVSRSTPKYRRVLRDLDISGRKVYLHLLVHQYICDCKRTFSGQPDISEPNKSYTKRWAKWVFELSCKQSHSEVGALTDTNAKTVERIFYDTVGPAKADWSGVKRIGIDEFAFRKGHKDYITVILDLDTHEILDILEQRTKDFIVKYFKALGEQTLSQIEEFSADMWGPFQDIGEKLFPNAKVVVDRFHWAKHLNGALDNYRKSLRKQDKDNEVFKRLKWKLIKREENLTDKEREDLEAAFGQDRLLEELYLLRNAMQTIFDGNFDFDFASKQIELWLERAKELANKHLDKFVQTFENHKTGILNYFRTRLSNGAVEGTNNLLRTVKRLTFNMTNFENFRLRVFAFKV